MGSIEVYDYEQMKWVPYVSTPEDAERYYQRLKARIDRQTYDQESRLSKQLKDTEEKLKEAEEKLRERTPIVKQITPVAQAIEIAESEVKRERKKAEGKQHKKTAEPLPQRVRKYSYY